MKLNLKYKTAFTSMWHVGPRHFGIPDLPQSADLGFVRFFCCY